MPGPLLHFGATVMCSHGGQAQPTAPNPRVLVSGQPTVLMATPYAVMGCPFVPPGGNGPCVTAQYIVASTRVLSNGQPLVIATGQAVCTPTGTPLLPVVFQTRVIAT